jgi:hypothetical protein
MTHVLGLISRSVVQVIATPKLVPKHVTQPARPEIFPVVPGERAQRGMFRVNLNLRDPAPAFK